MEYIVWPISNGQMCALLIVLSDNKDVVYLLPLIAWWCNFVEPI